MPVRAKFTVNKIQRQNNTNYHDGKSVVEEVQTISLYPVTGGTDENKKFFASTPCGSIELGIITLEAAAQFELGKSYYVDFTPAE